MSSFCPLPPALSLCYSIKNYEQFLMAKFTKREQELNAKRARRYYHRHSGGGLKGEEIDKVPIGTAGRKRPLSVTFLVPGNLVGLFEREVKDSGSTKKDYVLKAVREAMGLREEAEESFSLAEKPEESHDRKIKIN